MYDVLKISNFRGFREFSMDLKPITLIAGENNTGKTSILESVFLLHNYKNPDVFLKLLGFRGVIMRDMSPQKIWEPLFYGMDTKKILKITMGNRFSLCIKRNNNYTLPNDIPNGLSTILGNNLVNYTLSCMVKQDDSTYKGDYVLGDNVILFGDKKVNQQLITPFIQYMGSNLPLDAVNSVELFGKIELMGKKQKIIESLKILDESITDITTIMIDKFAQLYITNTQNIKMPLYVMGDGIRKIMNVALTMLANPSSILLLDEIENGLHYSLHAKFWALITSLAVQEKCQIIATTHSYECINGALEGIKKEGLNEIFAYTRLAREDDCIISKEFSSKILEFALSTNWEVR
ncbi:MAG: AAA family ATPase [Clostridiales bacterium]|jgi:AAA15 family ATPase/GTPase|nr:AAA family ATPase [Clostridiales bacterium]MDR2713614.1 AAA family ATPase [Clostridiales bacterium]